MAGADNSSSELASWWQAALLIRGQTEADQRNIRAIWIWCFVWAAVFFAVVTTLRALPQLQGPFAWLLAAIPIIVSILPVRAHLRFLREADEFMRKVQLEGIAIGYTAGFVFCMGYIIVERAGAPELPLRFAVVPMGLGWAIGSFLAAARYR
jgi:hypothetical protein